MFWKIPNIWSHVFLVVPCNIWLYLVTIIALVVISLEFIVNRSLLRVETLLKTFSKLTETCHIARNPLYTPLLLKQNFHLKQKIVLFWAQHALIFRDLGSYLVKTGRSYTLSINYSEPSFFNFPIRSRKLQEFFIPLAVVPSVGSAMSQKNSFSYYNCGPNLWEEKNTANGGWTPVLNMFEAISADEEFSSKAEEQKEFFAAKGYETVFWKIFHNFFNPTENNVARHRGFGV